MPRDLALIDRLAALHPAVVSDCLDALGHRHQVMAPTLRPLATQRWRLSRSMTACGSNQRPS